jgi:hypothetical protein
MSGPGTRSIFDEFSVLMNSCKAIESHSNFDCAVRKINSDNNYEG